MPVGEVEEPVPFQLHTNAGPNVVRRRATIFEAESEFIENGFSDAGELAARTAPKEADASWRVACRYVKGRVVLPDPLRPTTPRISPSETSADAPRTIVEVRA